MSYEDFLSFTTINECFYCNSKVEWTPHSTGSKKYNKSYNLDRKDNEKGYIKDNCVVCCTLCNFTRGNRFSFEEFSLFKDSLKEIAKQRQKGTENH
jgi:hypothetical protein